MHPMRSLDVIGGGVPLCRAAGHTCAACCHGDRVPRAALEKQLRRQTRLFSRMAASGLPGRLLLLLHELRARRGADLFWALVLLLPGVGSLLRRRLWRRTCCAFLGFEDPAESRVGCLLHPARWSVRDRRRHAFALLAGLGCGPAEYLCMAALRWACGTWEQRRDFAAQTAGLGWFEFGRAVERFGEAAGQPGDTNG